MWVSLAALECCSAEMDKLGCWVYQGGDLPGGAEGKGGCWKKAWLMWWAMTSKLERKRSEGHGMLVPKEKASGWPMDFKSCTSQMVNLTDLNGWGQWFLLNMLSRAVLRKGTPLLPIPLPPHPVSWMRFWKDVGVVGQSPGPWFIDSYLCARHSIYIVFHPWYWNYPCLTVKM